MECAIDSAFLCLFELFLHLFSYMRDSIENGFTEHIVSLEKRLTIFYSGRCRLNQRDAEVYLQNSFEHQSEIIDGNMIECAFKRHLSNISSNISALNLASLFDTLFSRVRLQLSYRIRQQHTSEKCQMAIAIDVLLKTMQLNSR